MNDINDIMPKVPYMKWGALMNRAPTNGKVKELNKIFPHKENGIQSLKKKIIHTLTTRLFGKKIKKIGHRLRFYD